MQLLSMEIQPTPKYSWQYNGLQKLEFTHGHPCDRSFIISVNAVRLYSYGCT